MATLWNVLRSFMIFFATVSPPRVGMIAAKICNRIPPYKGEEGSFRTDVAICVVGILRNGGIEQFEYWLGRYPFPNRWQGFFHPLLYGIRYTPERGWRIYAGTHIPIYYGKAFVPN
jgi:hypothetical protein